MAKQIINNGESGLEVRGKINDNFTELYDGISNVDNTSDADKPVSTAQAAAIAVVQSDIDTHEALTNNPHSVTKSQVGLGSADNTSDADKPVSTAQGVAIAAVQSNLSTHEALTNNPHSVTKTQVGLSNVDNTADTAKPVSTAQQTALNLKADLASPTFTGAPLAPTAAVTVDNTQIATTEHVKNVLPFVTPEMYGAVGDGVTNDAAAIQLAVDSGFPVMFGQKTYVVTSTVTIPSGSKIMGSGQASIVRTSSNIPIFTITNNDNITITDLLFIGSDTGSLQRGVYANGNVGLTQNALQIIISRCGFQDFGNAGIYVNFVIGSDHEGTYQISDCWFASNSGNGILFDTRAEYNSVCNCKFYNNGVAINVVGGNNNIIGGSITDNTTGLLLGAGTNDGHGSCVGVKMNHNGANVTSTNTAAGFLIADCQIISGSITLNGCTNIRFYNCDIDAAPLTSTNAVSTLFANCCFRTTPTMTIASGNNPTFSNNTFTSGAVPPAIIVNTIQGGLIIDGDLSPAQLTANTDNYAPTGIQGAHILRLSTDASRDLTGIAGGVTMVDGRELTIVNIGAQNLVLKNDVTSTAANRFLLGADVTVTPEQAVRIIYDGTSSRWRKLF